MNLCYPYLNRPIHVYLVFCLMNNRKFKDAAGRNVSLKEVVLYVQRDCEGTGSTDEKNWSLICAKKSFIDSSVEVIKFKDEVDVWRE